MGKPVESKLPVGLAPALAELGIAAADVLRVAGLPPGLLERPAVYLPVRDYFAFWRALREVSCDASIGLRLSRSFRAEHTEPLFLAMLSARDVGAGIAAVASYKRMLSPETIVVEHDTTRDEIVVRYVWPSEVGPPPQVLVDAELGFLVEVCRRATRVETLAPRRVLRLGASLEAHAEHAAFFGCPIDLGAPNNGLAFAREDTHRPFLTHNPALLQALEPYLTVHTPPSAPAAIGQVRATIAGRLSGRRPTVRGVGKELGMSTRALQRLLKDHGTSFRVLLDEVRSQHAQGYLRSTGFSDGEIAFLLGFADPNSFYRAFRAWTGQSPHEFRASQHVVFG